MPFQAAFPRQGAPVGALCLQKQFFRTYLLLKQGLLPFKFGFKVGELFPHFQVFLLQGEEFGVFQDGDHLALPHHVPHQ